MRTRFSFTPQDLAMGLVVLVWGTNFVVLKAALEWFPPLAFNALRFASAALVMLAMLALRERRIALPAPVTALKLVGLGLVGNTLYQLIFILGLSRTSSAHAGMIVAATPVLVVVFATALGIERLDRRVGAGVGLGVVGMLLVLAVREAVSITGATVRGDLMILASCVCWALYTVGVRTLGSGLSSLQVTTYSMLAGAPGLVLFGLPELVALEWGAIPAAGWATLAYATLFPLVIGYVVWNASIRQVGPAKTAIYNCAIPVIAVMAGWAAFDERPVPLQILGAAGVLAGVLLSRTNPAPAPQRERTFSTTRL